MNEDVNSVPLIPWPDPVRFQDGVTWASGGVSQERVAQVF